MGWLGDWLYRKEITLSRAGGAVADYQMKLLVGESSGATGEDVDCAAHCLSSFNDLRFTAADGTTLLDYWIESISGATPNQLATIWIEFDSIGTSATTFYMYYGNASAAAYSNGANTFIVFDDFERGNNGDAIGGAWTVTSGSAVISTEQAYHGTRSGKIGSAVSTSVCKIPVTPSANISIMSWQRKTDAAGITNGHGDNGSCAYTKWETDEKYYFHNGTAWFDSGKSATANAWHKFEWNNFNYTDNTFDAYIDDVQALSDCPHHTATTLANVFMIEGRVASTYQYIDCLAVRNWRSTGPAWGTWGTEEAITIIGADQTEIVTITDQVDALHLVDTISETATVADAFDGDMNRRDVTEQVTIADQMTGFDYHGKQTEAVTITDAMGRAIEATRAVEETITFSDDMEPLLLVDANTEAVTIGDSFAADEMIRKKTRHPRLQGKHLSLKFSSSAAGSFAVYYLRAKVHKTVVLERRPCHPNLQGRHLSLKLSHSAAEDFKMYYASAKMTATKSLSGSVHPNAQGSHIGVMIKHAAAESFRMDYAAMRLFQVKR